MTQDEAKAALVADMAQRKPKSDRLSAKALAQPRDAKTGRFERPEPPRCHYCHEPVQGRAYRLCRDCAEDVAAVAAKPLPSLWQRILRTMGW